MRGLPIVLAVVAAGALGTSALAQSTAAPKPIGFSEKEFSIKSTTTLALKHGTPYTVSVKNAGKYPHDLLIDGKGLDDRGIHNASPISPGAAKSFTVTFPKAGTYEAYCAIPGHRAKGMQLKLVVK